MSQPRFARFMGLPLSLQIVGLLIGVLVVAQITTLGLTLLLPPAPRPEYSLDDIAAALRGAPLAKRGPRPLERLVQSEPPSQQGPGWLVSEESRSELARLLAVDRTEVQLLFYTPLPFAGAVGSPAPSGPLIRPAAIPRDEVKPVTRTANPLLLVGTDPPARLIKAQFTGAGGGVFGPAQARPPALPGAGAGSYQRGAVTGASSDSPPRTIPRNPDIPLPPPPGAQRAGGPLTSSWQTPPVGGTGLRPPPPASGDMNASPAQPPPTLQGPSATGAVIQNQGPATPPDAAAPRPPVFGSGPGPLPPGGFAPRPGADRMPPVAPLGAGPVARRPFTAERSERPAAEARRDPASVPAQARSPQTAVSAAEAPGPAAAASAPAMAQNDAAPARRATAQDQLAPAAQSRGLFGLAPQPFIAGDFVAAYRTAPGQWVVVRPHPEPFPNSWQRRVLLWFAISLALVGPLGFLFARRLAQPLAAFADAAEQLGRDPTASVVPLRGPAEVGKAARAFNAMQARLKRYVDDRAGMMAAISHDLRAPLTRMRFRLENAPPAIRSGVLEDVAQMEQMIASFLAFMQESSASGPREKVDLRSIVECVIDDAAMVGGAADIEAGEDVVVEADILALKRVLANLVENAVKYGHSAQARLFTDDAEAVVEIADTGQGLPPEELEKVFLPFYRAPSGDAAGAPGAGLGLASSRATVRAHGGDIRLFNTPRGLVAQMRLPLPHSVPQRLAAE